MRTPLRQTPIARPRAGLASKKALLTSLAVAALSGALWAGAQGGDDPAARGAPQAQAQDRAPAEELVGRLLLLAYPGSEPPLDRLAEFDPAGFLFYPGNVESTSAARATVRALQEASAWPLLYGIDQEGGPFTSYRVDEATIFPGNMAIAATGDPSLAERVGRAVGEELAYAGFNLNFAPVVDVNSNQDNPIIGIRSFGADVATVSANGRAFLAGLEAAGVAAAAKHFPGHGDTGTDSHLGLPTVEGDRARLDEVELAPFRALIAAEVPAVMTAHVAFPAIAPGVPATLSPEALTGLLRDELGFDGVIVTDYMDMDAIAANYGAGEAAVLSVAAGADLVLLGPDIATQRAVLEALREAVRSGELAEERVRDAVRRTAELARSHPPRLDGPVPDYAAHRALAEEVAREAATLLWNDAVLPLGPGSDVLVVAPRPAAYGQPPHLGEVLGRSLDGVRSLVVDTDPSQEQVAAAVAEAANADVVILGTYRWLGAFRAGMVRLAEALAGSGKPLVVVPLGNPDDLRFLPVRPDAYLAVYGYREANLLGAAAVLTGASEPRGTLPVPVGDIPLGSGQDGF